MSADLYLRLDTLRAVSPDRIEWGAPAPAVVVYRAHLFREPGEGRVPYMQISEKRAARLLPVTHEVLAVASALLLAASRAVTSRRTK